MRARTVGIVVMATVVFLVAPQSAQAQVSIDVEDSTVGAIARHIAAVADFEVAVDREVEDIEVGHFTVVDVPAERALKWLAQLPAIELQEIEGGYRIVEAPTAPAEQPAEEEPAAPEEPEEPAKEAAEQPEPLVIDDMEGEPANRWRDVWGQTELDLVWDDQVIKEGVTSGRWELDRASRYISTSAFPHDWSAYDTLAMWIHSEQATNAVMMLLLYSENPQSDPLDYYKRVVRIDWEGWKELRLPKWAFDIDAGRQPVGWNKIDSIRFAFEGWEAIVKHVPGTVLRFDDIRVLRSEPEADRLTVFRADRDCSCWAMPGDVRLPCVRQPSKTGGRVTKWDNPAEKHFIWNNAVPRDWSDYSSLNMWLYCEQSSKASGVFYVESKSENTNIKDGYSTPIRLDWQGWKLVSLPLCDFRHRGQPKGWDQVDLVKFYGSPKAESAIYFDDMWLSKERPGGAERPQTEEQ